jgi:hypothetical protein
VQHGERRLASLEDPAGEVDAEARAIPQEREEERETMSNVAVSHAINPHVMRRAHDFYAAYNASCEGKNYQGLPCPKWQDLTPAVRRHWYAVSLRSFEYEAMSADNPATGPGEYTLGHHRDPEAASRTWLDYQSGESVVAGDML